MVSSREGGYPFAPPRISNESVNGRACSHTRTPPGLTNHSNHCPSLFVVWARPP